MLIKNGINTNKTYTVKIKEEFLSWKKSKHILRGIFETDGSLFFSKSKNSYNLSYYPRLAIKTASSVLSTQILNILSLRSFKVHTYEDGKINVIYLSGSKMLDKWVNEIGFSSDKNRTKYELWKKLGFYIPYTSLKKRKELLK